LSRKKKKEVAERQRIARRVVRYVTIARRKGADFPSIWMRGDGKVFFGGKFVCPKKLELQLSKAA